MKNQPNFFATSCELACGVRCQPQTAANAVANAKWTQASCLPITYEHQGDTLRPLSSWPSSSCFSGTLVTSLVPVLLHKLCQRNSERYIVCTVILCVLYSSCFTTFASTDLCSCVCEMRHLSSLASMSMPCKLQQSTRHRLLSLRPLGTDRARSPQRNHPASDLQRVCKFSGP